MPTYHLAYISDTRPIISDEHISEVLNIDNLEDAEKILAAEFYTLYAKKCKKKHESNNSIIRFHKQSI